MLSSQRTRASVGAAILSAGLQIQGFAQSELRELDAGIAHLGDTRIETWPAGTPDPVGRTYVLNFEMRERNDHEVCLLLAHHDVDDRWTIEVNGVVVGELARGKRLEDHVYPLPVGVLQPGTNVLTVTPEAKSGDDILIGRARLVAKTLRQHLDLCEVTVSVRELGRDGDHELPVRITITDTSGELAPVYYAPADQKLAVRAGVVYSATGTAGFELPRGNYDFTASRGMEWSIATSRVAVGALPGDLPTRVALAIERELDTKGYVAADTHLHTFTFSGHGDATVEERVVTLAAEGVEFAVATDHNHHTDYRPTQTALDLTEHYTAVIGNEVTTENGHFNAFPFPEGAEKPEHRLTDWVKLVDGMRAAGAAVVVLNHPRWPQLQTGPFGAKHFDLHRISGAFREGPALTFDAMELVNATTTMRDPLYAFVDWFALLNHGDRVMAVGTSDSHTVSEPVGQGRTYLVSKTDDPARIDVEQVCEAIRSGRGSIAHGIFTEVLVAGTRRMGDIATLEGDEFDVVLRVASPSWVTPERALLFQNGAQIAERAVPAAERGKSLDTLLEFRLPTPPNDAFLVCVVLGPGVEGRFWRTDSSNDYTLGATNPVWLDVDGDREYTSPRAIASDISARVAVDPDRVVQAIADVDDAVAVQLLDLLMSRHGIERARIEAIVARCERPRLAEFVTTLR